MTTLYRLAQADANVRNPQPQFPTRRAPGNVPYLVDNLWEWRRPKEFPNRRHSVFASPTPALAEEAGGAANGRVFCVKMDLANSRICQILERDARYHPDVKVLPKLINEALGPVWMDEPMDRKTEVAALWTPCLSGKDVDHLFRTTSLAPLRQFVWDAISFWEGARLVMPEGDLPYLEGEIFFQTPEYHLHRVASD